MNKSDGINTELKKMDSKVNTLYNPITYNAKHTKSICDARKQRIDYLFVKLGKPWVALKESFGVPEMSHF